MEENNNKPASKLFTPYKLGGVTLRNRTIRSAAFESMGKDFGPTQQLKDYHVSVARGGVGMTTLAYAAVCRSGLSFNKQLWLRPEIGSRSQRHHRCRTRGGCSCFDTNRPLREHDALFHGRTDSYRRFVGNQPLCLYSGARYAQRRNPSGGR